MGIHNPVDGSEAVTEILSDVWEEKVGGKIEFVTGYGDLVHGTDLYSFYFFDLNDQPPGIHVR